MSIAPSTLKLRLSHRLLAVKLPCGSRFGYILLYNNYLQIQKLITAHIYHLTVSVGQEFRLSRVVLAQGLSWDCSQDAGQGCGHPKFRLPRWLTHAAVGRRPRFLSARTLL